MSFLTNKNLILLTKALLSILIIGVGIGMANAGVEHDEGSLGNPPTPPGGIFPPVNLSSFLQIKEGGIDANNFESIGYLWAGQLISFGNALLGGTDSLIEIGGIVPPGEPANANLSVSGEMAIHRTNQTNGMLKASSLKNSFIDIQDAVVCATQSGKLQLCDDDLIFEVHLTSSKSSLAADDFTPAEFTWDVELNKLGSVLCSKYLSGEYQDPPDPVEANWSSFNEPTPVNVDIGPVTVYPPRAVWTGPPPVPHHISCEYYDTGGNYVTTANLATPYLVSYTKPVITVFPFNDGNSAELRLDETGLDYGLEGSYDYPPTNWERYMSGAWTPLDPFPPIEFNDYHYDDCTGCPGETVNFRLYFEKNGVIKAPRKSAEF
ncbi:MAG: hypothetical protein ACI83D_000528 [Planctomycetota bacterium]|jgi:hypothetical protein